MLLPVNQEELQTRIELNFHRLADGDYYKIDEVFSPLGYDWSGDKEGRALLAFVSHYRMSGRKIPCMEEMMVQLPARLSENGFLGSDFGDQINEQQLSGHSWLLRGLCEYCEQFGGESALAAVKSIVEKLYLPKAGLFCTYPVNRDGKEEGGVSGSEIGTVGKWILSSDVGCAFMSIDGLSHAYAVTEDERIKTLLDEMIEVYLGIDKVALKVQTHCTLTAARGMLRLYGLTKDGRYLDGAKEIFTLYTQGGGMTATYQNLNWWGRPDTWTEPCAIVDSMMLAGELYKITGKEEYRTLAARIYHNGLATAQRINGGAGTDSIVLCGQNDTLQISMYEAHFCCTMRLAEGLCYLKENKDVFTATLEGEVKKHGSLYADGDLLYAEVSGGAEAFAENCVTLDGHTLCPLVKYYRVPEDIALASKQRVIF